MKRYPKSNQIMKISERTMEKLIKQQVNTDQICFGIIPGSGTMNAIFILRQLKIKYLGKKEFVLWICRSGEGF